jgi:hypothetical protein
VNDVRVNARIARGTGKASDPGTLADEGERIVATGAAADLVRARLVPRFAAASAKRTERKQARIRRAHELRAEGLSAPMIGIRIAREEGRPDDKPYVERVVWRWLSESDVDPNKG